MIIARILISLYSKGTIFIYFNNFIYLFSAVLGLYCCAGFSLVVPSRGYSLVGVCRLLIAVASPVVEQGL